MVRFMQEVTMYIIHCERRECVSPRVPRPPQQTKASNLGPRNADRGQTKGLSHHIPGPARETVLKETKRSHNGRVYRQPKAI